MTSLLAGVWVANLAKSHRHVNHQFQKLTLGFDVHGDEVTLKHGGINMSGQEESGVTILRSDGLEHPVSAQAPGVMVVTRFVDPHTLETEATKDGQSVGKGTYAVSEDGRTLTATVEGIDGAGAPFEQVIVFDRA